MILLAKSRHRCGRKFLTLQCSKCGHELKVLAGSKDRTCEACANELYTELFRKYSAQISDCAHLKFLTLTWKPVRKQKAAIVRSMGAALVKFLHRHPYHHWKGVISVVECKKTRYSWFYYHIHCLFNGFPIPQSQISSDWKEISGYPIVWIKEVKRTPKRALKYILKYVLKGFSFDEFKDSVDFKKSMKGVHYIRPYGSFYDREYQTAKHIYFPCPSCGITKCWIVVDFCNLVNLITGQPYDPPEVKNFEPSKSMEKNSEK